MRYLIWPAVLTAAVLGAAWAPADDGKKVDERAGAMKFTLEGKVLVQQPVPLGGAAPAVLRTAKIGDRVLLQVAYEPEGSVIPKKITAKAESAVLTVVDVLPTGQELQPAKKEKGDVKPASHFAVLVRASAAGECGLELNVEMSDGSVRKVPFQFKVEK